MFESIFNVSGNLHETILSLCYEIRPPRGARRPGSKDQVQAQVSSFRGQLLEDEEPPVAAPLPVRKQPDAAEAAVVATQVEAQRAAVAAGVHEELAGQRERHHLVQLRTRIDQREVNAFLRRGADFLVVLAQLRDAAIAFVRHEPTEVDGARLEAL